MESLCSCTAVQLGAMKLASCTASGEERLRVLFDLKRLPCRTMACDPLMAARKSACVRWNPFVRPRVLRKASRLAGEPVNCVQKSSSQAEASVYLRLDHITECLTLFFAHTGRHGHQ